MLTKLINFFLGKPIISVGDTYEVGQFFWIDEEDFIGYAENASHGHGLQDKPGSADIGCTVEILKVKSNIATVVLDRPKMPYGAPAPIGTIFRLSVKQIQQWPRNLEIEATKHAKREAELAELGSVKVY